MQTRTKLPTLEWINKDFPQIEAIFFDMDGTLFPTEEYHARALCELLKPLSVELNWQDLCHEFAGMTDEQVLIELKKRNSLNIDVKEFLKLKNEKFFSVTTKKILLPDDLKKFIQEVSNKGLKLAIVTSSEKSVTDFLIEKEDIRKYFPLILTREDTSQNKPNPMPYLEAMKFYQVDASKVLIFEDSITGLEAAVSSKANVVKALWYEA